VGGFALSQEPLLLLGSCLGAQSSLQSLPLAFGFLFLLHLKFKGSLAVVVLLNCFDSALFF
jgi:hypothetical protein